MSVNIQTPTGRVGVQKCGSFVCADPISKVITQWVWLAPTKTLVVDWDHKSYLYKEVPFSTIHAMMSAQSLGEFLNKEVKPNYQT